MSTTAVMSAEGTDLINEPIAEVIYYRGARFHRTPGNRLILVRLSDGSTIVAFMDEIFITVVQPCGANNPECEMHFGRCYSHQN